MNGIPDITPTALTGPVVSFDYEEVFRALDEEEAEDGRTLHERRTDGLRRILDWMISEDQECLSTTKTMVSVRALAFAWAVFPSLVDGKSQSAIARELGVSRQFFSRQVVSLQRTLGIRSHTMRAGRDTHCADMIHGDELRGSVPEGL